MTFPELDVFNGKLLDGLEFCRLVYALHESIRNSPEGVSLFRLRPTRLVKKLCEELIPIARYIQASYRPGRLIDVRWIDGNQTYDAEISQRGYVDITKFPTKAFLEVTCPQHKYEHWIGKLLESEGIVHAVNGIQKKDGKMVSEPIGFSDREHVVLDARQIIDQIDAKTQKPYPPDTYLVVQCALSNMYMPDEWADLISRIDPVAKAAPFPEIYLFDPVFERSHLFITDAGFFTDAYHYLR